MKKIFSTLFVLLFSIVNLLAQSTFDMRYNEARGFFLNGEYKTAITMLERSLKADKLTKEQKAKANQLITQCKQEIEASQKLIVGRKNFDNLSFLGTVDSTYINVPSNKPWHIVAEPAWISHQIFDDMIYFTIDENPTHEIRTGAVEITLDQTCTTYINFTQENRPVIPQPLTIHTEPIVQVQVDHSPANFSPMTVNLQPGVHRIHAYRSQFESVDTTVVIEDDLNQEERNLYLTLKRQFATVKLEIVSDNDSSEFLSHPTLTIDGKTVDLRPNILGDYNILQPIAFYTLYSDGTIPLTAGSHFVKVSAPDYDDYEHTFRDLANSHYQFTITMRPKTGMLRIVDVSDARGAEIFIDGKLLKGVTVPCDSIPVKTGSHVITFRKEGSISTELEYPVEIKEKRTSTINVTMIDCDTYTFGGTLPPYATVLIDNEEIGKTPINVTLIRGAHHVTIYKDGYLTVDEDIMVPGSNQTILFERVMPETRHFVIDVDESYLKAIISQDDKVIATGMNTPLDLDLPLSKQKYKIVLQRELKNKTKTAYKGYFRFNNPKKNHLRIQSWSERISQVIELQYFVTAKPNQVFNKSYKQLGEASLFKFQLFKGMSTSVVKGKIFLGGDTNDMTIPKNGTDVTIDNKTVMVLPAFSAILVNEEFRIGGSIFTYMDANLLVAYAWYPKMTAFLPLSHVSGHDLFGGVEIASRFPVATVTLKFGYEKLLKGQANIYSEKLDPNSHEQKKTSRFASAPMDFGQLQFAVGISLGGSKSKGNNMIRLF